MDLGQAVFNAGGIDVVAPVLQVTPGRVKDAITGSRPMSAKMARLWNERFGDLYPVSVPEDKRKSKKITLHVQADVWAVAKKLAKRFETTPIRAVNELARVGSFGNFAATMAWLHAAKIVGDDIVPQPWRFFQSEKWGEIDVRMRPATDELQSFLEDWS